MKKTAILLVVLLALSLFTGCSLSIKPESGEISDVKGTSAIESFKTIGDLLSSEEASFRQRAVFSDKYVQVFEIDDTIYRVIAPISEELSDKLFDLDIFDEEYDEKVTELVSASAITSYENLSEQIPEQAELDKLIGKTGAELLDDGWSVGSYSLSEMEFYMDKDPFEYLVTFNEKIDYPEDDPDFEFDEDTELRPLTVKSITYFGLGDATEVDD